MIRDCISPPNCCGCWIHHGSLSDSPRDRSPLIECGESPDPTLRAHHHLLGGFSFRSNSSPSYSISSRSSSLEDSSSLEHPLYSNHCQQQTTQQSQLKGTHSLLLLDKRETLQPWYEAKVVPYVKFRPRTCDEVSDEFRRVGIGLCFRGKVTLN
ncbi:unnamed protein product [Lepeophtheirus salmonis]|uniref:(salmon louse) hypothetical protein n=1 Tax=Lepeophtheirus salmonis TaxID=72036 RepID=A0A0K2VGZ7_LEPSM|nr:unnamed protein product [Lepeophtheirus salmonis]CAF2955091.1 unnamed protein product [Lepeophtheirus salmonis]